MKNKEIEVENIFNDDCKTLEELLEEILYNYIVERIENEHV